LNGGSDAVRTAPSRTRPSRPRHIPPGEEALDHLVADLAAPDEEPEHLGPEELLDLSGVEVEEVMKAAVGEPTTGPAPPR
jgi:hypothetical protein